jgi:predicted small lipoprotein YifL
MMTKKIFALMMAWLLVFSLSACGDSSTQKPITDDEVAPSSTTQGSDSSTESVAVTIDETVLLDRDGLLITAKEFVDDTIWGQGVKVSIENNMGEDIAVQCNSLVANNYMISDLFSCSVVDGKKANDTIYLSSSELEAAGIATISDIVFSFHVINDDSYTTLFDTDEIELKTSAYGTVEQPVTDDGKELYNQDNIRIVGKYVDENSFWGAGILLFIENNYGENIIVQCDDMSINGFMVTPFFSCTVNNGRMAVDTILIFSSDLEENDITAVDDIELIFNILNSDTYETIDETDTIAFSTK